ncbi:MAG: stage II sporulation protein E [Veillonellales bacterium]
MPKVTVVTLPEEVLRESGIKSSSPGRRFTWRATGEKLRDMVINFMYRDNLPLNLLAFLLGRVALMGEVSPFGLAFFAAVAQVAGKRAASVGFWAIAGVASAGHYLEAGVYFFAILLYFHWADKLTRMHRKLLAVPLLISCAAAGCGLVLGFLVQATLYNMMLVLFGAAMCMVLACIFMYGVPVLLNRPAAAVGVWQSPGDSMICLVVLLAIAVAGLGNICFWEYSLRNIAASLLIMALAFSGGAGLGASVGVAAGLVAGLTAGNVPAAISLYALAGLLGGVFRNLGKFAVILGFLSGGVITLFCFGQEWEPATVLGEFAVAAAVFLVVPAGKMTVWKEQISRTGQDVQPVSRGLLNEARAKLNNIADMFSDLAKTFALMAAQSKEKIREDEVTRALAAAGEQVCGTCTRRSDCWEKEFYRTYQAMLDMLEQGESRMVTTGNMPELFKVNCLKRPELVDRINAVLEHNRSMSFWQRKLADHRQMVTEQLKATGNIISNLSQEIAKEPCSDKKLALLLREKAALVDCPLDGVRVTGVRGSGMIELCKQPCGGTRECINTVLPLAASIMQEKLTLQAECGSKSRQKKCKLTLQVASRFSVVTGVASAAKEREKICGDTCAVVPLNKGKMALILSDGMGTGNQAAGESTMAVGFLEKLLTVGFDVDVAVKTVNSLLLLRTPDETFATVDMAIIDTYSGETEFLKIGAAPSYVKRVREVTVIQSSSLPIGILHQIEIEPVKSVVVAGDVVVMVSDGIADVPHRGPDKGNWVANLLRRTATNQPQELADKILGQAMQLSGNPPRDDMTVLVAKVVERPQ